MRPRIWTGKARCRNETDTVFRSSPLKLSRNYTSAAAQRDVDGDSRGQDRGSSPALLTGSFSCPLYGSCHLSARRDSVVVKPRTSVPDDVFRPVPAQLTHRA